MSTTDVCMLWVGSCSQFSNEKCPELPECHTHMYMCIVSVHSMYDTIKLTKKDF